MKALRRILVMLILLLAVAAGFRYVLKGVFFPYKYETYIDKYSREYDLDPLFVLAVMKTESGFNENAHSHKNAVGLMQITVETGEWAANEMGLSGFSKEKLFDEEYNIRMGCWYLKKLNDMFDGNLDLMVAAYNAGPTNVNRWLNDNEVSKDGKNLHNIPFGETEKYVNRVNTFYNIYKYIYR